MRKSIGVYKGKVTLVRIAVVFVAVAVIGIVMVFRSGAAGFLVRSEAEAGAIGGNARVLTGLAGASGSSAVAFGPTGGGGGGTPADRTDAYCGGSSSGPIGGQTQPIPTPPSGKTLTVGSGKQYTQVNQAISVAAAGDNIVVSPGTYGTFSVNGKSGAQSRCITIVGDGVRATVTGGFKITNSKFIRIINLEAKNASGHGIHAVGNQNIVLSNVEVDTTADAGILFNDSRYILIDGCEVHAADGGAGGPGGDGEAVSIADGATDAEVRFCKVYNIGEEGIDAKYAAKKNTKIHHNEVFNAGGPEIYIDGSEFVDVYNNFVHSNAGYKGLTKAGIGVASETTYGNTDHASDINIYNNVVYDNKGSGIQFYTETGGRIYNVNVYNNTVVNNAQGAIDINTSQISNVKIFNNILNGTIDSASGVVTSGNFTGDAMFVGNGDYRLKPGSPAIDKAPTTPPTLFDMLGVARPKGAGIDYGAYEQ